MSNVELEFPPPIRVHGRLFWRRSEIERYKRQLIANATGVAPQEPKEADDSPEVFVPSDQVAREFGFGRRTLGRRIAGKKTSEEAA